MNKKNAFSWISLAVLSASCLVSSLAQAQSAYILEYDGDFTHHTQNIEDILCDSNIQCRSLRLTDFSGDGFTNFEQELRHKRTTVNLSFSLQYAEPLKTHPTLSLEQVRKIRADYDEGVKSLTEEIQNLENLFATNPETFFSIAAGNGHRIVVIQSKGIALGHKIKIYPATSNAPNAIIVAALADGRRDQIADYSNYGLTQVDVAAPVLPNKQGQTLQGTSYASPYVAKLAVSLQQQNLSPLEIKEIFLKSCEVKNIDAAIAASEDLNRNKENSATFKAMHEKRRVLRERLQLQLGDIMLVRCGGALNEDLVRQCTKNYLDSQRSKSGSMSITESCLQSHSEFASSAPGKVSSEYTEKLKKLWNTRGI